MASRPLTRNGPIVLILDQRKFQHYIIVQLSRYIMEFQDGRGFYGESRFLAKNYRGAKLCRNSTDPRKRETPTVAYKRAECRRREGFSINNTVTRNKYGIPMAWSIIARVSFVYSIRY